MKEYEMKLMGDLDQKGKVLWHFYWDCGRMGFVESYFIATPEEVVSHYGEELWFGEILGKHSEIHGHFDEEDLKIISTDPSFVRQFEKEIGSTGHNPLEYLE